MLNRHDIWVRFHEDKLSTNEIAKLLKHEEHEVEQVIYDCMTARAMKKPMPWETIE